MRGHGPPWRWRDQPPYFAGRRMPRRFVRRMGCAFAALITLAAVGASTLVSLLWRSPQQVAGISPVAVTVPAELPAIEADPVRIRQVLLNLLANALRHTPEEADISIEVEARPQRILICVRDNGSGIAPEDLPHIFERFQKGAGSRGSGLGLAIARKLVLAHDGEIGIESAPGQGTVVTVSLPR